MIAVKHFGRHLWGIFSSTYSLTVREECKCTPGLRWTPEEKSWCGYADAVAAAAKRIKARGVNIQGGVTMQHVCALPIKTEGLYDFQKKGVEFLVCQAQEGALLADQMGIGKTVQGLRAARAFGGKTVVVCPSFVKGVWVTEARKWWKEAKVEVLSGIKPKLPLPDADIYVANYDIIHAWVDVLIAADVKTLIGDEGHYLMSDRSRRSRAFRQLARAVIWKMILTGTPMTSRPRDLWNLIDTLSEGRFGRPFDFYLYHCDAKRTQVAKDRIIWDTSGASNLDELRERLAYPLGPMLRRTMSDVAMQLPPRIRQIVEVDVKKTFIVAPGVAMKDDKMLRKALDMAADGKIKDVIEAVSSHVEEGHKVVVFTKRRDVAGVVASGLVQSGISTKIITGDVPRLKREAIIDEQPSVICATMESVAVGIDMSFADVAVFAELDWVPSTLLQAEARLYRKGQSRSVLIQYIIAKATIDDVVRQTCLDKLARFEQGIGVTDDRLIQDLEGAKISPAEVLRALYERMSAEDDDEQPPSPKKGRQVRRTDTAR